MHGWDQSWGYANPKEAYEAGYRVVSLYLSHDQSKNATAEKVKAYHAAGIGVVLNWESDPGRPLGGRGYGLEDGRDAVTEIDTLIQQVGYGPRNILAVYFSCDRQISPGDYPSIDGYFGATKEQLAGKFLSRAYGEADLVDHLVDAGLTDLDWQTLAWSEGRVSKNAVFYQKSINNTLAGASVDLDEVTGDPRLLGAWWPPASPYNTTPVTPVLEEDVPILIRRHGGGHFPLLVSGGRAYLIRSADTVNALLAKGVQRVTVAAVDYDNLKKKWGK